MKLGQMLDTFDDISLEAISSKGVIRRAKRDLLSSKHEILEITDQQARINTDGQTVTLNNLGPRKAICTCPAASVCRHIVLSILALKKCPDSSSNKTNNETSVAEQMIELESAKDQALQLTNDQLRKFAGADWNQALIVAESYDDIEVVEHGSNCTISIPDSLVRLTLISGQNLKESVYKGPKTKQRLLTTVCLILLRKLSGIQLNVQSENLTVESEVINAEFLNSVKQEVLRSIGAVINGTPEIAVNRLYDLAISARVQSAPRLVSQLRTLAKQASLATTRHISFQPGSYIKSSANAYSLLLALEKTPDDLALTGTLKRNYFDTDPIRLWVLGATKWKTPNGARGLTAYAYSEESKEWYSIVNARAAGSDPMFLPETAYHSQVWNAGLLTDLVGGCVLLEQPRISGDSQISLTLESPGRDLKTRFSQSHLDNTQARYSNLVDVREYLSYVLGSGVKRTFAPKPFLFSPSSYTTPYFDNINQVYYWGILDNDNNVVDLQFSGQESNLVNHLSSIQYKIKALLVTAEYGVDSLKYKLCSVVTEEKGALNFFNLSFDKITRTKTMLDNIKSRISSFNTSEQSIDIDPIAQLSDSVVDLCVKSSTSRVIDDDYQVLIKKAQTVGLEHLSRALTQMRRRYTPEAMLKVVYIASEIQLLGHTT